MIQITFKKIRSLKKLVFKKRWKIGTTKQRTTKQSIWNLYKIQNVHRNTTFYSRNTFDEWKLIKAGKFDNAPLGVWNWDLRAGKIKNLFNFDHDFCKRIRQVRPAMDGNLGLVYNFEYNHPLALVPWSSYFSWWNRGTSFRTKEWKYPRLETHYELYCNLPHWNNTVDVIRLLEIDSHINSCQKYFVTHTDWRTTTCEIGGIHIMQDNKALKTTLIENPEKVQGVMRIKSEIPKRFEYTSVLEIRYDLEDTIMHSKTKNEWLWELEKNTKMFNGFMWIRNEPTDKLVLRDEKTSFIQEIINQSKTYNNIIGIRLDNVFI